MTSQVEALHALLLRGFGGEGGIMPNNYVRTMTVDEHRQRGCEKKYRYRDRAAAQFAIAQLRKRLGYKLGKYRCPHCRSWHIGHPPKIKLVIVRDENDQR